jgi:hypothetical protein
VPFVPADEVTAALEAAGVPPDDATAIVEGYKEAQVDALRIAFATVAALVVLAFWFTRHLPTELLGEGEDETAEDMASLATASP